MSLKIFLIDINEEMCKEWENLNLSGSFKIINGSVDKLKLNGTNVFISPSNSLGLMRGGIDNIYQKMFPSIENDVRNEIQKIGYITNKEEFFLPVASSLLIPISEKSSCKHLQNCKNFIISCPSMLYPGSNISHTNNAYWCYKSIFSLVKKLPFIVDNLIIPGIGTGIGQVSYKKCAQDFIKAIKNFDNVDESPNLPYLVTNTKITKIQSKEILPFKNINHNPKK